MRTYQLYLIEDEFASHYFGRERILFNLFYEFQKSYGEMKSILSDQINYVTKPISQLKLQQQLQFSLKRKMGFTEKNHTFFIINEKMSTAKLTIFERYLKLESNGYYDAETIFFEVLRKLEPSFLAIDLTHYRFGWLKPIKERNLV
ncbi:sporulation inhibitor of replication protein SirA [Bacillus sp. 03113]|uniref:sporulation inhibitor of replication protein SirA n=1 Tax=Bacillus sp. 03113 TaxID=2578211 RepID=UPI0011420E15|nr:sporulation inhibitor of replication protein SirA [Bacillus sp. 03113]